MGKNMAKELSIELQEGESILLTGFANRIGPWGGPTPSPGSSPAPARSRVVVSLSCLGNMGE